MMHSVDSVRLAEAINAEAVKKGVICDILIEVNIACEDTKFGIKAEDIYLSLIHISGKDLDYVYL